MPLILVGCIAAACETRDTADDVPPGDIPEVTTPVPADPSPGMPAAGDAATADFTAVDGSAAAGTIRLEPANGGTRVTVMLTGAGEGAHQGHIHGGSCQSPGGVVAPLEPVTTGADGSGEATSTVDMPPSQLRDGQHVVLYHQAGGTPGTAMACAPIPAA